MSHVLTGAAPALRRSVAAVVLLAAFGAARSPACVGVDCMLTWSTEEGGGALTLEFDFAHKKVQTFRVTCPSGQCFYSAVDPGFMNTGEIPPPGFHTLVDGTSIRFKLVEKHPAAIIKINGRALEANESALLGTTPELHSHPSWQLSLPEGQQGDYPVSFTLTSDSPRYAESQVFEILLTNLATPTPDAPTASPTPTPTATVAIPACVGDCDGSGAVTVAELVLAVASALDGEVRCAACDRDRDGAIEIGELVTAVNSALDGCAPTPTPTTTAAPELAVIQRTIFSPRCAIPSCHTAQANAGNLILDPDHAYTDLVGVEPSVESARIAGLLRVDAGHPENSFLLVKLGDPPPDQGSPMPLGGPPLSDGEIQLIRDWIARGAAM
jgi:hypothetical protein